jgi:nucleoside-diphosphate-sugar epimerase
VSILVTGIGFVGAYIVRDLLAQGHDVVVFGLLGGRPGQLEAFPDIENAKDILGEQVWGKVRVVVGDIRDREQLSLTVKEHGVTGIVHLAALVAASSERDIPRAVEVNVGGSVNVFDAAVRHGVERVAWASSINVFGPRSLSEDGVIADDSPVDPTSAYGATKACVEHIARRYHANHGLSVVGLRLGKVYGYGEHVKAGRGGGNTWFSSLVERPARGIGPNIVPFGDKSLDFQYVEDVSCAFLAALASRAGAGESFLNAGDYRPIREAFAFVCTCLPDADMELVDGAEAAGLQAGAQTNWTHRYDASRAKAILCLAPRCGMEEGLRRTIDAYRLREGMPPLRHPPAGLPDA